MDAQCNERMPQKDISGYTQSMELDETTVKALDRLSRRQSIRKESLEIVGVDATSVLGDTIFQLWQREVGFWFCDEV